VLVVPKWLGVDRDTPKVESGQRVEHEQVARRNGQADRVVRCGCQCCAALRSPAAPGRGLCYGCLRFGCKPEDERTFMGTYAEIQSKRVAWEASYPGWRLCLASEWRENPYPTKEDRMGRQRLRQRFLVRKS